MASTRSVFRLSVMTTGRSFSVLSDTQVNTTTSQQLGADETDFNRCVSHVRACCNEHAIGVLKGRWKSLTELPIRVFDASTRRDIDRAYEWIPRAGGGDPRFGQANVAEDDGVEQENGEQFRARVMEEALRVGRAPAGIVEYIN
ncbi:hypothetical protein BGX23_002013, partial [Mortierella sp. AD031]